MSSRKLSVINSVVSDISDLHVYGIPSAPIDVVKAVRVDRTIVLVDKDGTIYSTQVTGSYAYSRTCKDDSLMNTLAGAFKLGAISKTAYEQDRAYRMARDQERQNSRDAEDVIELTARLGVPLTGEQKHLLGAFTTKLNPPTKPV